MDILIIGTGADTLREKLSRVFPTDRFIAAPEGNPIGDEAMTCTILVARSPDVTRELISKMPRLRFIQALTTGTDHIEALPNLSPDIVIAAARGIHGPQMSELAFLFMLAFTRGFPGLLASQKERRWDRRGQRVLVGKTAVLVGIGAIAEELAKRCRVFGMRVIGVSSRTQPVAGFDAVYPRTAVQDAAAEADFLIVLAPYNDQNHHLIDRAAIGAMKPSAFLINLSRGGLLDEEALGEALTSGRLGGAALDVFSQEPLPSSSPLWDLPNILITPHIGGMSETYLEQALPLLVDNIGAFLAAEPEKIRYLIQH